MPQDLPFHLFIFLDLMIAVISGEEYNYETPRYERYNPHPGKTTRRGPGKLKVAETEFLRRADLNNLNSGRDST
jgi:hypothetical protein